MATLSESRATNQAPAARRIVVVDGDVRPVLVARLGKPIRGRKGEFWISVWCPHCRTFHSHGWDLADPREIQSRWPHCMRPNSPYKRLGGYLIMLRPEDAERVRKLREAAQARAAR